MTELTYANVLSTIALLVSLGSFMVAAYNAFRDRPRLKVTSTFYDASEWGPAHMSVAVVNKGRRPVILRLIGGNSSSGSSGTYIEHDKGGLRLGEHERHEFKIDRDEAVHSGPDGPEDFYDRMWIEDSLGNQHSIPKSREYIARMLSH